MSSTANESPLQFSLLRNANLFSNRPGAMEELETMRETLRLSPEQLLHPDRPGDFVVRRGKLRVSQFLPDGREVTRAVLQAGSVFFTRAAPDPANSTASAEADQYALGDIVLMTLNEGELWFLPPGTLEGTLPIAD